MRLIFAVFFLFIVLPDTYAQSTYKRRKPKNAYAQGTLDFAWGYNRSGYSNSTIRLWATTTISDSKEFELRTIRRHFRGNISIR